MKNIRIISSCLVGGEHAEAGSELKNVDNGVAADLVHSGRAVEIKSESKTVVVENRDPVVENRDPKPATKKVGKKGPKKTEPEPASDPSPDSEKES